MRLFILSLAGMITLTSMTIFMQEKNNTISDKEKREGWQLLFDGKSTHNWKPYKNAASDGWEVVNGELHCKENGVQHRADLVTIAQYKDFEFSFDWKVTKGANSGVLYHVTEDHDAAYQTGPEYQLIDDIGYPGTLEDWQKSGSDYAMHPPSKIMARPAGEYNHSRIVVKGAHVEHWLNGEKVVDFDLWTPEWEALKSKSKWKDAAGYGKNPTGHIALQDHGGGTWFRNLKIKPL
jgi:hypothetical protein